MIYKWPWIKAKSTLDPSHNHLSARRTYKTFLGFFDHTIHHRKVLGTITNISTYHVRYLHVMPILNFFFVVLKLQKHELYMLFRGAAPLSNCPKLTTICHFLFKLHAYHSWPFKNFSLNIS